VLIFRTIKSFTPWHFCTRPMSTSRTGTQNGLTKPDTRRRSQLNTNMGSSYNKLWIQSDLFAL